MNLRSLLLVAAAPLMALAPAQALAQTSGTPAGTNINNTATITYSVGGANQSVNASAAFLVDRRVNLTVAAAGAAATTVSPAATDRVAVFTVTNNTNGPIDLHLEPAQDATGVNPTARNGTDSFDVTNVRVVVDANGNGTYESGTDVATFIDELPIDGTRTVLVVVDVPGGASSPANNAVAGVTLTARAAAAGTGGSRGALLTETTTADDPNAVDTVFGDAGDGEADTARNGAHAADEDFRVSSAALAVLKRLRVVQDPFNNTTNPKAIPGATLEYCISVQNNGSASADTVTLSDPVPANMSFVSGSLKLDGTVTGGACNADTTVDEDDDLSGAGDRGGVNTGTVSATWPTISAGATTTALFRVTVD